MVATKTQPLEKQKALQLLNNFFDHFKNCCRQKQAPDAHSFQNIISQDFHNMSNGAMIGKNAHDFLKRIQDVQKKFSMVEFSRLQDCLMAGNKAILEYDINLTAQNGEKHQLHTIAIATIDNDLITHWTQVSHEKDKDHMKS